MSRAFNFSDPDFLARSRALRDDFDAGVPMTLGEMSDRLGMAFEVFAEHLAIEFFRQAPGLGGVVVGEIVEEALH